MPRIKAATVAEHREQQLRALLDGARAILGETGEAPPLAEAAQRAGLARSSVYHYFSSSDDLLAAVVADVFPSWAEQVLSRMESAGTPGEKVWAYVRANLDLFTSSQQAVAQALRRVVDPQVLQAPMKAFHAELQAPLVTALTEHGEADPELMAQAIDAVLLHVARATAAGSAGRDAAASEALLRRLLEGYLGLRR